MRSHLPVVSSIIIVISLFVYLFDSLSMMLVYERDAILDGEFWRVFSGHLVHFSGLHFSFNIIALGVTGWIIEKRGYPGFGLLVLMMSFVIGVSMMALKPNMQFYGGLSGIAHGALVY
jgi:rhomboid family GlyGly-CTERM serine protease